MTTPNTFGPLVGPWDVEAATITTINDWLDSYLNELEREHGLAPRAYERPPTDGVYGGLDFDTWTQENSPAVIVVVAPYGEPEPLGSDGYEQWFTVQVGSIVVRGDAAVAEEHQARQMAGFYATAIAGLLTQQHIGEPGVELVSETLLTQAPAVEFPDPEVRRLARGTCAVRMSVSPIVDPRTGPAAPDQPPPTVPPDPGDWPTVTEPLDVTVTAEPLDA